MTRVVHGIEIHGSIIDDETRCAHHHTELDIIALKFKCCSKWFPCRTCHDETESHEAQTWPKSEFSEEAVLCGKCGNRLSVDEYLNCVDQCPSCGGAFNPRCAGHYNLYFDIADSENKAIGDELDRP